VKDQVFLKSVGKNTGLGLFLSAEIVSMTGISIRETGVPGAGARFEIFVPEGKFRFGAPE
jgi:signal transduction histidine kinase